MLLSLSLSSLWFSFLYFVDSWVGVASLYDDDSSIYCCYTLTTSDYTRFTNESERINKDLDFVRFPYRIEQSIYYVFFRWPHRCFPLNSIDCIRIKWNETQKMWISNVKNIGELTCSTAQESNIFYTGKKVIREWRFW
jgi:hypothetical protein